MQHEHSLTSFKSWCVTRAWSESTLFFHENTLWRHCYKVIFLFKNVNPLNAKFIKWSNKLKQFIGKLPTNCLSVFDHFVGLAFKGLNKLFVVYTWNIYIEKILNVSILSHASIKTLRWQSSNQILLKMYVSKLLSMYHRCFYLKIP